MKYILIANNSNISSFNYIDSNSILVLFNNIIHIDNPIIYNHPNKFWVSRINQKFLNNPIIENDSYAGMHLFSKYYTLFKKIYLYTFPSDLNSAQYDIFRQQCDKYNILTDKILPIDDKIANLKKEVGYPKYKNMSTGFIFYHYLYRIDPGCKIILAGFTSDINKSYHHPSWEKVFFAKEYNKGQCEMLW